MFLFGSIYWEDTRFHTTNKSVKSPQSSPISFYGLHFFTEISWHEIEDIAVKNKESGLKGSQIPTRGCWR